MAETEASARWVWFETDATVRYALTMTLLVHAAMAGSGVEATLGALVMELHQDGMRAPAAEVGRRYAEACELGSELACERPRWAGPEGPDREATRTIGASYCASGDPLGCLLEGWALTQPTWGAPDPAAPGAKTALERFRRACRLGLPRGCAEWGQALRAGIGELDPPRARRLLERACADEVGNACAMAAAMYADGEGGAADVPLAVRLSETGCALGDGVACAIGDRVLRTGTPDAASLDRARALIRAGCELGVPDACTTWGDLESDAATRGAAWRRACSLDDGNACFREATRVHNAAGGGPLGDEASTWVARACELGHLVACNALGVRSSDLGTAEGDLEARELFERACAGDVAKACENAGMMHDEGRGGPTDEERALVLYGEACSAGIASACNAHGVLSSKRANADLAASLASWVAACDGGAPWGCVNAARAFRDGRGAKADAAEAVRRSLRAAELFADDPAGRADALVEAGRLLRRTDLPTALATLSRALSAVEEAHGDDSAEMAVAANELGLVLLDLSRLDEASAQLERARVLSERHDGPDSARLATVIANLAVVARLRRDSRAHALHVEALAIRERIFPPEHPSIADSLVGLALLEDDDAEEEALLLRALSIREASLGPEHSDTGEVLFNLGFLYTQRREYARALAMLERALAIDERIDGADGLSVAHDMLALADVAEGLGEYPRARACLERALAIRERRLGPGHPDVAAVFNNLADHTYEVGDFLAADAAQRRALAIDEAALGPSAHEVGVDLSNLARIVMKLGREDEAGPLLERALAIQVGVFGPRHHEVASVLRDLAALAEEEGDLAESIRLEQEAVAMLEETLGAYTPRLQGSLRALARRHERRGEPERTDERMARLLALQERVYGHDSVPVAQTLADLAWFAEQRVEYPRARELAARAFALLTSDANREHAGVATALRTVAEVYMALGEPERARDTLVRLSDTLTRTLGPEHPETLDAVAGVGAATMRVGDYATAEPILLDALGRAERALGTDAALVASILVDLAALHEHTGSPSRAIPLLERAHAIRAARFGPSAPGTLQAESNLGSALGSAGRTDDGIRALENVLASESARLGADHPGTITTLNNLAGLYNDRGDNARALELVIQVRAVRETKLGPDHPLTAQAYANLGYVLADRGELGAARESYEQALAARERAGDTAHPEVIHERTVLAWLQAATGDLDAASRTLAATLDAEERHLSRTLALGTDARREALVASTSGALDLAVTLDAAGAGVTELALTAVLRRKGRVLDAAALDLGRLRESLDEEGRAILAELGSIRSEQGVLVARSDGAGEARSAFDALEARAEALEASMATRSAAFRSGLVPVEIADVARLLPADAALVELVRYRHRAMDAATGERRYAAYVLRGDGTIGRADLGDAAAVDAAALALRGAIVGRGSVTPEARAAWDAVMAPIAPLLGDATHLFVSPDGACNLLPFDALRAPDDTWAIERWRITLLSSARDLVRLEGAAPASGPSAVVYDPDFAARLHAGAPSGASHPPLPGTRTEGRAVRRLLRGEVAFDGAAATEDAVRALASPRILHLATHGFFSSGTSDAEKSSRGLTVLAASPRPVTTRDALLRSGLVLAGADWLPEGSSDGILTAAEIAAMDLRGTELVVLSACETGVGEVRNGEGVYGLRRAVALAGARSQVLSLWKVDDAATAWLMKDAYRRLRRGEARDEAFRQAQLALLHGAGGGAWSAPVYWAAFARTGAWSPIPTRAPTQSDPIPRRRRRAR